MKYLFLVLLVIWATDLAFAEMPAAASGVRRDAQTIYDTMMSPYCPGRTISACPSSDARELRTQVRTWLEEGQSTDDVRQRLVNLYGPEVLGVPGKGIVGTLGWILPGVFVLFGIFLIAKFVGRKTSSAEEEKTPVAVDPEMQKIIEQELAKRR